MSNHILFLRHFRTSNNMQKLLNGRSEFIPISESNTISCNVHVNTAFCSSALRCRQTLGIFRRNNFVDKIYYTNYLLERDLGSMEGEDREEMAKTYTELFYESRMLVFSTPPGGETYNDFYERAKTFWLQYIRYSDGNVLICSHNQILKMLSFIISEEPVTEDAWRKRTFPFGEIVLIK